MLKTGLALLVGSALAACGGSTPAAPATNFAAVMAAPNEVPPITTSNATGTFTATLSGTTLSYTVTWTGLSGNATAGHIHVGSPSAFGGVVAPFVGLPATASGTFNGTITPADVKPSGAVTNFDDLLVQMRGGNTYANIHTNTNSGGEIRGQIAPK